MEPLTIEILIGVGVIAAVLVIYLLGRYANKHFLSKLDTVRKMLNDPDVRKVLVDKFGNDVIDELDKWSEVTYKAIEDGRITVYEAIELAKSSYPLVRRVLMYVLGTVTVIGAYCS